MKFEPTLLYNTAEREPFNEVRDCSVIAVTLCLAYHDRSIKYAAVHSKFAELGRRPRGRTPGYITTNAIAGFGYKEERWHVEGKTIRTAERELPDTGAFLITIRGHHCAYVFGRTQDWTAGRLHRIKTVHRIVPKR